MFRKTMLGSSLGVLIADADTPTNSSTPCGTRSVIDPNSLLLSHSTVRGFLRYLLAFALPIAPEIHHSEPSLCGTIA